MNTLKITFLLSILFSQTLTAQLYKHHDWDKNPTFFELSAEDAKLSSIALKEKNLIQYYFKSLVGNKVKLYQTTHSIIRVNNEKGINRHNKVYIPTRNVVKVIDIKARVITKDGKIKILNKNNIKELKNVKDYGNFKIFAFEGLTKDSQLEYIYTVEKKITSIGSVILQKDYKVKESEVIIRGTSGYRIKHKSYNGFVKLKKESVDGNKTAYKGITYDIPAMIEEKSSASIANRMKVTYIAKSNSVFVEDDVLWNKLTYNIRGRFVNLYPSRYKKLIKDYQRFSNEHELQTDEQKINSVCDYIHKNYHIIRDKPTEFEDLKSAIRDKQVSEFGVVKIYTLLINHYKIPFEVLLTSNRYRHKFDRSFFSNLNLNELFFYFPNEKKFIDPTSVLSYLGYPSKNVIGNKGIFIGKANDYVAEIVIPDENYTITNRKYNITVEPLKENAKVSCNESLTGYKASNNRGAYRYFKKKDINEYINNTVGSEISDVEVHSFEVENEKLINMTKNIPFVLNYNYEAESLVESIGSDFLLNIGKVIGKQVELYQEVKRVNPVEISYLNKYTYEFVITIPTGYKPINLDSFVISNVLNDEKNETVCRFVSKYTIEEDKIIINVIESYNQLIIDKNFYEPYRNVINTAYDFSKKSILFERI